MWMDRTSLIFNENWFYKGEARKTELCLSAAEWQLDRSFESIHLHHLSTKKFKTLQFSRLEVRSCCCCCEGEAPLGSSGYGWRSYIRRAQLLDPGVILHLRAIEWISSEFSTIWLLTTSNCITVATVDLSHLLKLLQSNRELFWTMNVAQRYYNSS